METKQPRLATSCLRLCPVSVIYHWAMPTDLGEPRRLRGPRDLPRGASGISGPTDPPPRSCNDDYDVSDYPVALKHQR